MSNPLLEELKELIRKRAVKRGKFILSSGERSKIYVDMRLITLHPLGAYYVGRLVFDKVMAMGEGVRAVAGPVFSGVPIATAVVLGSYERNVPLFGLAVRKEPKSHGRGLMIEGVDNVPKGSKVVIVDDVLTKGSSITRSAEVLRSFGYDVIGAVVLLDRREESIPLLEGLRIVSLVRLSEVV